MTIRTILRRTAATLALAGIATGASALAVSTASASEFSLGSGVASVSSASQAQGTGSASSASTVSECTSNQFTAELVYGGAGMGNRNAAIQITANPGERCYLPGNLTTNLVGAHNVLLTSTAPADAPNVALTDGSSAYIPLHWTGIEAAADQQTPNAITFDAPADSNMHGDYIDPTVSLDWTLGAVDASANSHTIEVGAVTQGTAPTA
ncbi:DUF4232 domain-containing protein [Amycolatopsis acidicola]|uniref:DUF4232 domain-containing protein n=1 Tax=Amycolatopsis acidicola TaxID=2596893 RepID=A0A5N0VKT7_9PSEU|nr:DUF4232 domain-containing protein [Amycolatopsis acidicola]KAA9166786.1 DUF4232 domain-containing protein [Amycolatopsis acidicola]